MSEVISRATSSILCTARDAAEPGPGHLGVEGLREEGRMILVRPKNIWGGVGGKGKGKGNGNRKSVGMGWDGMGWNGYGYGYDGYGYGFMIWDMGYMERYGIRDEEVSDARLASGKRRVSPPVRNVWLNQLRVENLRSVEFHSGSIIIIA